jgi:hypothetical protein
MHPAPYMQRIDCAGVLIHGSETTMRGTLTVPDGASGLVIFVETRNRRFVSKRSGA